MRNSKSAAILSLAIMSGLLTGSLSQAEDMQNKAGDISAGKNGCNGQAPAAAPNVVKKKTNADKNSCKNSCGAEKKADAQSDKGNSTEKTK